MVLGASFSHRHLEGLRLSPLPALKAFKQIGFKWIRLGCYWDEIEKDKGKYSLSKIGQLITTCQKLGLDIVLTVGMKAPRYPEFYLPTWLEEKVKIRQRCSFDTNHQELKRSLLQYLAKTIERLKHYSAVKVWQVENEPLDPSGPNRWRITTRLLKEEAELVRKLDPSRPVLINLWSNQLIWKVLYRHLVKLADIVGLDLYFKRPFSLFGRFHHYFGPFISDKTYQKNIAQIKSSGKQVWLTELQAEPWEPKELVTSKENPPSCLPQDIVENSRRVLNWGLDGLFFWGFEYWYWRKEQGDSRYWNSTKRAIAAAST
jgi:hypothetical protein